MRQASATESAIKLGMSELLAQVHKPGLALCIYTFLPLPCLLDCLPAKHAPVCCHPAGLVESYILHWYPVCL